MPRQPVPAEVQAGPSTQSTPQLIYDGDCALCRMLAAHVQKRAGNELTVLPWDQFSQGDQPTATKAQLGAWHRGELFLGPDAWQFLLENYRDLKSLGWLARKLGLVRVAAKTLDFSGHAARRLCLRCRWR